MAVFKLRQAARQLAELEHCAEDAATRACLVGVRRALMAAAEELQRPPMVVAGDDETRLVESSVPQGC